MVDAKIEWADRAAAEDVSAVLDLAEEAARADGVSPLSEQTRLELRHGAPAGRELLARGADGSVLAYGHLDLGDAAEGPSGEFVVRPGARGRGLGRAVAEALVAAAGGRLRVWAHGKLPAAGHLASSLGFEPARELWQMRRPARAEVPAVVPPEGITLDTFTPGRDEAEWLALNAKAFAHHAEQGRMTLGDLERRMAEPWFDPAGFFVARRDGRMVGFHWTKVHPAHGGRPAEGEVYVVGVDPVEQGSGLGRLLTAVGLRHLAETVADDRPLDEVLLYVDADNAAAVRVYTRLGFGTATVDVMYRIGKMA